MALTTRLESLLFYPALHHLKKNLERRQTRASDVDSSFFKS